MLRYRSCACALCIHVQYDRQMGAEMEPFNLKAERDTGYFDESGGYVWKDRKDDKVMDAWLAEVDEEKIVSHRAKAAAAAVDDGVPFVPPTRPELFATVLANLKPGETVPTALRRLRGGGGGGGGGGGWREKLAAAKAAKAGNAVGGQASSVAPTAATPETKVAFDALTEAADILMGQGMTFIYQEKREKLEERAAALAR